MNNFLHEIINGEDLKKTRWQWRPRRWIIALIILAVILVAGGAVIRFSDVEPVWMSNFTIIVLILFAVWTVFYEREWPVWKRVLWVIGLWFAVGVMAFLPFALILAAVTMRRSTFFVEPAVVPPQAAKPPVSQ